MGALRGLAGAHGVASGGREREWIMGRRLISAGTSAIINVAGLVVNEAQTLNAYWHPEWVQQTGMFSSDIRHNAFRDKILIECV
jgi:hypothetical protein